MSRPISPPCFGRTDWVCPSAECPVFGRCATVYGQKRRLQWWEGLKNAQQRPKSGAESTQRAIGDSVGHLGRGAQRASL